MRVATMVRGYIPAPRPSDMVYAPIDLVVAISEYLTKKGHSVDFYGPNGTSLPNAHVETYNLRPLVTNQNDFSELILNTDAMVHSLPAAWDNYLVREMFEKANNGEYDLLYFTHPESAFPYVHLYPNVPVVYTLHDPISGLMKELMEMYMSPSQFYISISENQRLPAPDLPYIATVYNGIDTELFTRNGDHDDYLLFAGRIVPEKGVKEAVQIAVQTNHRLLIIGPVYSDHQDYFDQHIKPYLNENILYLGFVEREQLVRYFQKAKAFLMPIQWEEPFGLTMAEAMACGTPVIAMNRGSISEIIVEGKTGFICNSIAEMVKAVKKVDKLKAEDCRNHIVKNFSYERMVDSYEDAFKEVLKKMKSGKNRKSKKLKK